MGEVHRVALLVSLWVFLHSMISIFIFLDNGPHLYGDMDKQAVQHLPAFVLSICVSAQVALSISMQSIVHDEAEIRPLVLFFLLL